MGPCLCVAAMWQGRRVEVDGFGTRSLAGALSGVHQREMLGLSKMFHVKQRAGTAVRVRIRTDSAVLYRHPPVVGHISESTRGLRGDGDKATTDVAISTDHGRRGRGFT